MPLYNILVCTIPKHLEETRAVHPAGKNGQANVFIAQAGY